MPQTTSGAPLGHGSRSDPTGTPSAAKALRVSARRRAINDRWRLKFRALERRFRHALTEKASGEAATLYVQIQSTLDRMARRNILHRNAAARKKSRFSALVRKRAG